MKRAERPNQPNSRNAARTMFKSGVDKDYTRCRRGCALLTQLFSGASVGGREYGAESSLCFQSPEADD